MLENRDIVKVQVFARCNTDADGSGSRRNTKNLGTGNLCGNNWLKIHDFLIICHNTNCINFLFDCE